MPQGAQAIAVRGTQWTGERAGNTVTGRAESTGSRAERRAVSQAGSTGQGAGQWIKKGKGIRMALREDQSLPLWQA